jgi:hypothetical protein
MHTPIRAADVWTDVATSQDRTVEYNYLVAQHGSKSDAPYCCVQQAEMWASTVTHRGNHMTIEEQEDQIMDIKLALLGLALWSNNRYRAQSGRAPAAEEKFAIVHLGSERHGGHFAFINDGIFFNSRKEAFDAALKLASNGAERTRYE